MTDLIVKDKKFLGILTQATDEKALSFRTIDDNKLQVITDWMPAVNKAASAFSKQNSQTSMSLMTMNMIDAGPYRVLRQITAQATNKRQALKENIYELQKKEIEYRRTQEHLKQDGFDDLSKEEYELELKKMASDMVDARTYIEGALKELGALRDRYYEVLKNNNIPEDWDEADFERAEIEHHIKTMFRLAIRDRMGGTHNQGTLEYFHQFGINGVVAYRLVDGYLAGTNKAIEEGLQQGQLPNIQAEYEFLDNMYEMFKEEYKHALKRIGLDKAVYADWLMKEHD